TVVAGSLTGLRFAPLAPQLAAFAGAELEDARRIVEKIVTLEGTPVTQPAEVVSHPDGVEALAWLLTIEEEAVEALQDCIPLLGLLPPRPRRELRARAHAGGVPHHRRVLLLHGRDVRRGDGDVPRGRRLVELRPARVQRARLVLRRLGPDAQLHGDDRHLGVL